jgi:predicted MFS family arabinose efflux permease
LTRTAFAPLRVAPFRRLAAGYTINLIGDRVGLVALALLVYDRTRSALATTALFVAMELAPALAAPALTARLDRLDPRRTLAALYAAEGLLFLVLALLARDFLLGAVVAVAFLDGVLMLTARGLIRAAINAVLAPRDLLREGNAVLNVGFAVASVGGAAIGGGLVELVGVSWALVADAASFAAAAVLVGTAAGLVMPGREAAEPAHDEPLLRRLRAGLGYARSQPLVRLLLVGEGIAVMLFALIVPIEVVYARETLQTDSAGYGILLAAWGAGVVLGSVMLVGAARAAPLRLIALSTVAIGAAYLGMGLADDLWAAALLSVLGGIGNGIQWVSVMTALQEATPDDLQARIAGLLESIASAATGVGYLLGGVLTALLSPAAAFMIAGGGILMLVATIVAAVRLRRPRAAPSAGA